MPNRTISLSPIGDLIRERIVKEGIPFSQWIEERLLHWNSVTSSDNIPEDVEKPKVPWYYECQLCHQKGHHQSNCSMYNPVIESEGETE